MKIEMINEHQIRCTLTREDLETRQIKLSELAYGSEKAKLLFRDMMQQASEHFGFEADDIPLMIEAIPLPSESIMLIISKVDAPDELDTRFSSFTQDGAHSARSAEETEAPPTDLSGLIAQIHSGKRNTARKQDSAAKQHAARPNASIFSFSDTEDAIRLAHRLSSHYQESNLLFYDAAAGRYYLVLHQGALQPADFDRINHIASEYLHRENYTTGREAYLQEHYESILSDRALAGLAQI